MILDGRKGRFRSNEHCFLFFKQNIEVFRLVFGLMLAVVMKMIETMESLIFLNIWLLRFTDVFRFCCFTLELI